MCAGGLLSCGAVLRVARDQDEALVSGPPLLWSGALFPKEKRALIPIPVWQRGVKKRFLADRAANE